MAGYGQFTGYEPNPEIPGAYNFARANGPPLTFGGGEAEQLKARLDAYNSVNQPQVAGPGGGAPDDAPVAPPQGAGYAPPEPPPQPRGDQPVMLNAMNTGWKLDETRRPYREGARTAGVSQAQLQKKATQGTALPTAQSESVSGGFERDADYEEGAANARIDQSLARDRQREADLSAEQAGQDVARQQFVAQTAQLAEQQNMVKGIEAQVAQAQATRDAALKDYTGQKVEPERIFSGEGGGARRASSAIAVALGAYAATMGKTQNFAQQIVDNQISRDIAAQEADIRIKKDKSDTALGDLVRRGMTLDQAKGTLGTIQREWARNQIAQARGSSASEAINAKYDALDADFTKRGLEEAEDYRQKSLGTATKAVQAQIAYPQAGGGGGRVYATPDEAVALAGKTAGTEGTVAGTAKTIGEIGNTGPNGAKNSMFMDQVNAAVASLTDASKNLSKYEDGEVSKLAENRGALPRAANAIEDFVMGQGSAARGLSERDKAMIQDTEAADGQVRSLTSVLSGQGALSGPETDVANKGLSPGATVGEKKRAVALVLSRAQAIQEGRFKAPGGVPASPEETK